MKPIASHKGYFYVRKNRKPNSWTLYYEFYDNAKRTQQKVPTVSYADYGFKTNLTLAEAR